MLNFTRYRLFKRSLRLRKTHDFCKVDKPILTVVMIHGIASDSTTFRQALCYLEGTKSMQSVRFVTFDLLGSGKSYKSKHLNYTYDEQLAALEKNIAKLGINTPLILLGHSMGTFIVTRYASIHKKAAEQLILVSPPVYRPEDFKDSAFSLAIKAFEHTVNAKELTPLSKQVFRNSMDNIVLDQKNYQFLAKLRTPATLIYGDEDKLIATQNIPGILKANPRLSAVKTHGRHGVTRDKYVQILKILEEAIYAKNS